MTIRDPRRRSGGIGPPSGDPPKPPPPASNPGKSGEKSPQKKVSESHSTAASAESDTAKESEAEPDAPQTRAIPPASSLSSRRATGPAPAPQKPRGSIPAHQQQPIGQNRVTECSAKIVSAPSAQDGAATLEDSAEELPDVTTIAIRSAPPWLISMVIHLLLLLGLALAYFPEIIAETMEVEISYVDREGEQLLDNTLSMSLPDLLQFPEPAISRDLRPTEDPLASPPEMEITFDSSRMLSRFEAPSIGIALTGRQKGSKRALLAAYGGTAATESAVLLGLEWLKRNQRPDGTWSLEGKYSDGVDGIPNPTAATSMAMLAFLGNGQTHQEGGFTEVVSKGTKALLEMQDKDGNFFRRGPSHHRLYSQAQATIAVCELYGMTRDPELREPAQRALDYAAKFQAPYGDSGGGWRYNPGQDVDTSVTGWFVTGLQSGKMAGLGVSSPVLDKVSRYLDQVTRDGSRYSYRPDDHIRPSMTAEALLCRQYLGWKRKDPRLVEGVEYLLDNPINWDELDVYYWYYATQVIHHMGGDYWDRWNEVMRRVLPEKQVKNGREEGSWDPRGDPHGYQGGRLYVTCFCIYMLEVYYRHLPIYQHGPR